MTLRNEFSFTLLRLESIQPFFYLIRNCNPKSATIHFSNNPEWVEEVLKRISHFVDKETLFASVSTFKYKGYEHFSIYLSFDEDNVKGRSGELFVLTKQQIIPLGDCEEFNGTLNVQCTQDVEAMITVTSKVSKLPYQTVKKIVKNIFNVNYYDVPDFFNVLESKVLPNILHSKQIKSFISLLINVTSLGKAKLHAYNQTRCYVQEKEEYLNQIMAY